MGDKYLRPGATSSEYSVIVFRDTGMVHVHSSNCHNLPPDTYTPAKVFCNLEASGDWKLAAKLLKQRGFEGQVDQKTLNVISSSSLPAEVPLFWEITKDQKSNAYKCTILTYEFHLFCHQVLHVAQVKVPGDFIAQLVKAEDCIIDRIIIGDVWHMVIDYLEEQIKPYNEDMFKIIYKAFYDYWHSQKMDRVQNAMKRIQPNLLEEEPDRAYIYYANGYLEIDSNGFDFKGYKGLETFIWRDQINSDRDWLGRLDSSKSNWHDFCWKISGEDAERFEHLRRTYGYLLHSFKDRANPKAVIFVDEELKEDLSKASGGTGKSIAARAVECMKNTVEIAGKTWDPVSRFAFNQVKFGHKIMWVDDAQPNLKFGVLYNALTQDFEIERKGVDRFAIPFKDSPKILISTNHPIKGDDASSVRRQHIVEIAPYFSKDHTAMSEYGERLVEDTDWVEKDWQLFDNFMIECVVDYLKHGLKELEINYRYKRTVDQITPELYEWIEETLEMDTFYPTSTILHGRRPKDNINGFRLAYPDIKKSSRYIGADLEVYCNYKGYYLKKDREDKRGYRILEEEPIDED